MLRSHALHISRRATSEADEQSIPLASSSGVDDIKPATLEATRQKGKSRRFSLIAPAFARAIPDDVQLKAIAQVTEDRRRASVAIRRQSLIQSLHDDASSYSSPKTYASGPRGSISALMPEPSSDDTIGALPPRRYSIAEQGRLYGLRLMRHSPIADVLTVFGPANNLLLCARASSQPGWRLEQDEKRQSGKSRPEIRQLVCPDKS